MPDFVSLLREYASTVTGYANTNTTTERTYYPAVRDLWKGILRTLRLPSDVRSETSERRFGGGRDNPDVALYDGNGDFILAAAEVKLPTEEIEEIAMSQGRNDQVGRYLALTRCAVISNVRAFALVTVDPDYVGIGPVPPVHRRVLCTVELWPSATALTARRPPDTSAISELVDLLESAVTNFAPISEPESLARILARQANRAQEALPPQFTTAVQNLLDDFGASLGVTFSGAEGEHFFRSSLIQTVFYGLFAGWLLHVKDHPDDAFRWEDLSASLPLPLLGSLFHELEHPTRLRELGLRPYLQYATETLSRVHIETFFEKLQLPSIQESAEQVASAIIYFYEPFLEAFDPVLREDLGVWYTPPEIIRYQVQKVDQLLRSHLGCEEWGIADPRVILLDPCCGTGAYLVEVVRAISEILRQNERHADLGERILDALLSRIVGFELLTAPFVIAHLQLYLMLKSLGIEPRNDQRLGVFLTNALTGWTTTEQAVFTFPELQQEYDAARNVKSDRQIIVIMGNPPYRKYAGVPIKEEQSLADHYKGIQRDGRGRQIGQSRLFSEWRIRKHALDDLYIRFFRLSEFRIAEQSGFGIVSFISNSSFLRGRSHPIMRESLTHGFSELWIDNMHGNRKASERTPWGESCETLFNMPGLSPGIQVGTSITTMVRREGQAADVATVHYRDFWGRAAAKRESLIASLQGIVRENEPSGPRNYQEFVPVREKRWKLIPYDSVGGYDDWAALDELFPVAYQGVNANRGYTGGVIEFDQTTLVNRMRDYYSNSTDDEFFSRNPVLAETRARYNHIECRAELKRISAFDVAQVKPYVLAPLDKRWIYYEVEGKLINEKRPELGGNLENNEFLCGVPQPSRTSESRPMYSRSLFDLHYSQRGIVGFPLTVRSSTENRNLFDNAANENITANLDGECWLRIRDHYGLQGELDGIDAIDTTRKLFYLALVIGQSPAYQTEHAASLAEEWMRVPIPGSPDLLDQVAETGALLASLLDPLTPCPAVIEGILGERARQIAVLSKTDGSPLREADCIVSIAHFGSAAGGWRLTANGTGDLYLNEDVCFRNVPEDVWRFELGGYQVVKKWIGYRDARRTGGKPLSIRDRDWIKEICQRLAAILALHPTLDELYQMVVADPFSPMD